MSKIARFRRCHASYLKLTLYYAQGAVTADGPSTVATAEPSVIITNLVTGLTYEFKVYIDYSCGYHGLMECNLGMSKDLLTL